MNIVSLGSGLDPIALVYDSVFDGAPMMISDEPYACLGRLCRRAVHSLGLMRITIVPKASISAGGAKTQKLLIRKAKRSIGGRGVSRHRESFDEKTRRRFSNYKLGLWYSSRARLHLREGERMFQDFRYPECVLFLGMAIEFCLKAVCAFLGEDYIFEKPQHDVSKPFIHLAATYPDQSLQFSRAAKISSQWVGANEQFRSLVNYGNQEAQVPAGDIVREEDASRITEDAMEAISLLDLVEKRQRLALPRKLGILSGVVDGSDTSEKPCPKYRGTEFNKDQWKERFSGLHTSEGLKYEVEEIPVSRIGSEYAVVLNPFGEIYPERDSRKRRALNILMNYVEDGGILVNVGGFPFFWVWDTTKGEESPAVEEKVFLPQGVFHDKSGETIVWKPSVLLPFAGSFMWRELSALTSVDSPMIQGAKPLQVYQQDEDRGIVGDLVKVGGEERILEFRALRKETPGLIPFLRAKRADFGEVYPLAAIKVRSGHLLVAGMATTTLSEFEKTVTATDRFCDWLATS